MKRKKFLIAILLLSILSCCLPVTSFAKAGDYVTVGGFAIGLELDIGGVAVVSVGEKEGAKQFEIGDVITKVDGKSIDGITTLRNVLKNKSGNITFNVIRNGEEIKISVKKNSSGELGITVRDELRGVGTVTYIKDDGTFASLGHPVGTTKGKSPLKISGGKTSSAVVLGVNKGEKGKAGELKAVFVEGGELDGTVVSNTNFGVYGKIDGKINNDIYKKKVMIASREKVALGKATILSTVDGKTVKEYDIEIVSVATQKSASEKGIVIKIVDKELLQKTGGIVQGMSGSPIMQNGKLVGAVTHVFLNDSTRGYGIFAEFME